MTRARHWVVGVASTSRVCSVGTQVHSGTNSAITKVMIKTPKPLAQPTQSVDLAFRVTPVGSTDERTAPLPDSRSKVRWAIL